MDFKFDLREWAEFSSMRPTVLTVYLDLSYAYMCDNRRTGGFLISDYQNGG